MMRRHSAELALSSASATANSLFFLFMRERLLFACRTADCFFFSARAVTRPQRQYTTPPEKGNSYHW